MNEPKKTKDRVVVPEQKAHKKPYEKPQIIYRAPLEAMASACLPAPPGKAPVCTTLYS